LGGYWGSRLPDVFEPANSPHHRAMAHSLATGTAISATAIEAGEIQVRSYPNSFRGNFATKGYEWIEQQAAPAAV